MKKNILLTVLTALVLTCAGDVASQNPTPAALKHLTFKGSSNTLAYSGNLRPTADGQGFLLVGTWGLVSDFARTTVVRLNANLQVEWTRVIVFTLSGGDSFQASYGCDVVDLGNDEFVVLSAVNRFALTNNDALQNLDYALTRFTRTSTGATVQWTQCYGGDFSEVPHSLLQTSDGALLISGYSNPEQALNVPSKMRTFLVKTDLNGNQIWNQRYADGSECNTTALALVPGMTRRPVIETADGGYVFTSHCDERVYITKVQSSGEVLWTRQFVGGGGIGDGIEDAELGALGVGAGAGGTIIGIREMPNGDLAFLGNYLIVLAGIVYDGQQQQLQGTGVALPMGYVFTTDAAGNFQRGTAFFREKSYVDATTPIEMLCQDFLIRPNGNVLVTAGVKQFGNNGEFHYPALLELDLSQTDVDAAVVRGGIVNEVIPPNGSATLQYNNNDNARGQSYIHLAPGLAEGSAMVFYNLRHLLVVNNLDEIGQNSACLSPLDRTHTFPFVLDINPVSALTGTTLPSEAVTLILVPGTLVTQENCSSNVSSTYDALTQDHPLSLVPSLVTGNEEVQVAASDDFWLGARCEIFDLTGQVRAATVVRSVHQKIDLQHITNGVFFVRVSAPQGGTVVLKGIKQ